MLRRLARSALDLRGMFRSTLPPASRDGKTGFFALTLVTGLAFAGLFAAQSATAREPRESAPSATTVATLNVAELPPEGRKTYRLIHSGGPFPFEKDGVVFGNREKLLPAYPRGYYREYTVVTPRARNRGARRIICGGAPTTPEQCYYTADHYSSFRKIVE